jgi:hypothetical protein
MGRPTPDEIRDIREAPMREKAYSESMTNTPYASKEDMDAEERIAYRKKPDYTGYEDYTPSGRAALKAYNQAMRIAKDPSAAKKAQAAQRETAAEIKRETRGTVPEGRYAKGGSVSASKRADGIAQRGKTRGTMVMCGGGMAKRK